MILEANQLCESDYYADDKHKNRVLSTFKNKIKKENELLKKLYGFIIDHATTFDSFPPNGYSAIYYFLVEEVL